MVRSVAVTVLLVVATADIYIYVSFGASHWLSTVAAAVTGGYFMFVWIMWRTSKVRRDEEGAA